MNVRWLEREMKRVNANKNLLARCVHIRTLIRAPCSHSIRVIYRSLSHSSLISSMHVLFWSTSSSSSFSSSANGERRERGERKPAEKIGNRCEIAPARCMPGNQDYLYRVITSAARRIGRTHRKTGESITGASGHKIPRCGMRDRMHAPSTLWHSILRRGMNEICGGTKKKKKKKKIKRPWTSKSRRANIFRTEYPSR